MEPQRFTLRELAQMADGKRKSEWEQTSHQLAVFINTHRDPKSRPVSPKELNPYYQMQEQNREPDFYISPGELAKKLTESN